METPTAPVIETQLTDILGLRHSGIFPKDKEPSIRTLRSWTQLRRIPHHRVGHFVYYDGGCPQWRVASISESIDTALHPSSLSPRPSSLSPPHSAIAGDATLVNLTPMFSHLDKRGRPAMVDVGAKPATLRTAHAVAVVALPPALAAALTGGEIVTPKGAVFATARLAGIAGAKRTADLIPLCHPLRLDAVDLEIEVTGPAEVTIHCRARATERTGVEMEALTGATVAALTLYDMAKSVSHGIEIRAVRLLEKTGGRRDWRAGAAPRRAGRTGKGVPKQ